MRNFKHMMKDRITLVKSDGSKHENIVSIVQQNKIVTADAKHPLEEGDIYQRTLPSGVVEEYIVLDTGYLSGVGGIAPHYQSTVTKKSSLAQQHTSQSVTYNVSGANSRVNINSTDNSSNFLEIEASRSFEKLLLQIEEIENISVKKNLQVSARELENSYGTPSFLEKYKSFVAATANHITVLAPAIQAITKLL